MEAHMWKYISNISKNQIYLTMNLLSKVIKFNELHIDLANVKMLKVFGVGKQDEFNYKIYLKDVHSFCDITQMKGKLQIDMIKKLAALLVRETIINLAI